MFFTCVYGRYKELIPIYKYCIERTYPNEKIKIIEIENPSCFRFLINPVDDYVHVTDIDILILPHEKTHREYYTSHVHMGACYLGGVIKTKRGIWDGYKRRIAGGHAGFLPEFYERTNRERERWKKAIPSIYRKNIYREFDEVMLHKILKETGYTIPDVYKFPDGTSWNIEYRDVHLGDFRGNRYKKWLPDKVKLKELLSEIEIKNMIKKLSLDWKILFDKILIYSYL